MTFFRKWPYFFTNRQHYHEGGPTALLLLIKCNLADRKLWIVKTITLGLVDKMNSSSAWPRNCNQRILHPSSLEEHKLWKGCRQSSLLGFVLSDKMNPRSKWMAKAQSWPFQTQLAFNCPRLRAAAKVPWTRELSQALWLERVGSWKV